MNSPPASKFLGKKCSFTNLADTLSRASIKSGWQAHVNKDCYLGEWDVIALRCARIHTKSHRILQCFTHDGFSSSDGQEWINLPSMKLFPEINNFIGELPCPVKSVRLMRLHAGAKILPHRDYGLNINSGEARLHLPMTTSSAAVFYVAGEKIPMNIGELWYIDADKSHWATNSGRDARIHVVIDCVADDWLKRQLLN